MLNDATSSSFGVAVAPFTLVTYPNPPNLSAGNTSSFAFSGLYSFRHFSAAVSCSLAFSNSSTLARKNFWRMTRVVCGAGLLALRQCRCWVLKVLHAVLVCCWFQLHAVHLAVSGGGQNVGQACCELSKLVLFGQMHPIGGSCCHASPCSIDAASLLYESRKTLLGVCNAYPNKCESCQTRIPADDQASGGQGSGLSRVAFPGFQACSAEKADFTRCEECPRHTFKTVGIWLDERHESRMSTARVREYRGCDAARES